MLLMGALMKSMWLILMRVMLELEKLDSMMLMSVLLVRKPMRVIMMVKL